MSVLMNKRYSSLHSAGTNVVDDPRSYRDSENKRLDELQPLDPKNLSGSRPTKLTIQKYMRIEEGNQIPTQEISTAIKSNNGTVLSEVCRHNTNYIDISTSPRIADTPVSDTNANISFADNEIAGILPESCSSTHLLEDDSQCSFHHVKTRTKIIYSTHGNLFNKVRSTCYSCLGCFEKETIRPDHDHTTSHFFHRVAHTLRLPGIILAFFLAFVLLCVISGLSSFSNKNTAVTTTLTQVDDIWWKCCVMYDLFPASFRDTNNDGFGDINGIIERLNYFKKLNIDVIRLGSVYSALDYPVRYKHVIDFDNLDPHLGKIGDFKRLIEEVHKNSMHVVIDLNPSITSDQHPWAAHWALNKDKHYSNFFVSSSRDSRKVEVKEVNGSSSLLKLDGVWREPIRGFGGHALLNWSNENVNLKMETSLRYWLDSGVDGFYMKHLDDLHTDNEYDLLNVVRGWRILLNDYSSITGKRKMLMCSATFLNKLTNPNYQSVAPRIMENFDVLDVKLNIGPINEISENYQRIINMKQTLSKNTILNVHTDDQQHRRTSTYLGTQLNKGLTLMLMMVPATVTIMYGQEVSLKDAVDPENENILEDGQLSPMIWSRLNITSSNSSLDKWWLPVHSNFTVFNVQDQSISIEHLTRLSSIRRPYGICSQRAFAEILVADGSLMVLRVVSEDGKEFPLFINFSTKSVNLADVYERRNSTKLMHSIIEVVVSNSKIHRVGELVEINRLIVYSREVLVTQIVQHD